MVNTCLHVSLKAFLMLNHGPPQAKDAARRAQAKMPMIEQEERSNNEYKRGVSGWNFDLDDLKAQAALVSGINDPFMVYRTWGIWLLFMLMGALVTSPRARCKKGPRDRICNCLLFASKIGGVCLIQNGCMDAPGCDHVVTETDRSGKSTLPEFHKGRDPLKPLLRSGNSDPSA